MTTPSARREAAQRAVVAARGARVRRRRRVPDGFREAGEELAEGLLELVAFIAFLLAASAAAVAVRWSWVWSPPATVAVIALVVTAETLGLVSAFRSMSSRHPVRRLPALALGLAAVVGWGVGTAAFYGGWW